MSTEQYNLIVAAKLKSAQFNTGMKGMSSRIRTFSSSITGLQASLIALPFASVGVAAVRSASELESAERRFKISFSNLQYYGNEFQEGITDALGRSRTEIISSMVSFKQFFQGLDFGAESAAVLSKKMTSLSIDLASFFNLTDQQASKRFLAALAGSPEVLDQFGINLKEAAVKQELLNMGITVGVQRASEFQKTIARLSIIDDVMGKNGLVGFAIENTDLFSNSMKELQGRVKTLYESFGKELLPFLTNVVTKLSNFIESLSNLNQIDKRRIIGITTALATLPAVVALLPTATTILSLFTSQIFLLGAGLPALAIGIDSLMKSLQQSRESSAAINNLNQSLEDTDEFINVDAVKEWADTFKDSKQPLTDAKNKLAELQNQLNTGLSSRPIIDQFKEIASFDFFDEFATERDIKSLKLYIKNLEAVGEEAEIASRNTDNFATLFAKNLKDSFEKIKDFGFEGLLDPILEKLFSGMKIEPMRYIDFKKDARSLETRLLDAYGMAFLRARAKMEEISLITPEYTKIITDQGRRIGMAFRDGIVVATEDIQSLLERFRSILITSITGIFESLGTAIVTKDGGELKNAMLGILGSAITSVGSAVIAFGVSMLKFFKAATSLNAPAIILAGGAMVALGSAISATAKKEFGGTSGTASSAQFIGGQLTGQSSFGQVLVAEVDYDKLRFVLNNGSSSSFRSNG